MQFVSWNCRGMGSKTKEEAIKDLVRMNSPEILLIQETKMEEPETIQASKKFWKKGEGRAVSSRGASVGIATFENSTTLDLLEDYSTTHWLFTKLQHRDTGHQISLFNIYAPVLLSEKREEKSYRDVTAGLQQTIPDMIETRSTKKGKASKGATPPPSGS